MNAGLGTLTELKTHLLNEQVRAKTTWDTAIENLGLGVAGLFEDYCNRKFFRTVGDTFETNADRLTISLPRYPVESIASVELRENLADGWQDQGVPNDLLFNLREKSGLIDIGGQLGSRFGRLRITFTGGFWWDTDEAGGGSLPSGATARPQSLFYAWLLQCENVWQARDKLGINLGEKRDSAKPLSLASMQLVPQVLGTLNDYRRFAT